MDQPLDGAQTIVTLTISAKQRALVKVFIFIFLVLSDKTRAGGPPAPGKDDGPPTESFV
jgi:hypothetical protein